MEDGWIHSFFHTYRHHPPWSSVQPRTALWFHSYQFPEPLPLSLFKSVCLYVSMNKQFDDTMFQVMFLSSWHQKIRILCRRNISAHDWPSDLLSCDKWKCHRAADERYRAKSLLNDCDGCHVQEAHVWINVAYSQSLLRLPPLRASCHVSLWLLCQFVKWIRSFLLSFFKCNGHKNII